MKLVIGFKCPDAVDNSITDEVENLRDSLLSLNENPPSLEEIQERCSELRQKATDVANKFVEYGEFVRIEIDIDAGTARVLDTSK